MVIALIALGVVALLGPVAAYYFAATRLRKRGGAPDDRVRQLENEVRRLRTTPVFQQRPNAAFPPLPVPPVPPGLAGTQGQAAPPAGPAATVPAPVGNRPVKHPPRTRHVAGAGRFAQEPLLFGDEEPTVAVGNGPAPVAPQPPVQVPPAVPQVEAAPPAEPETPPPHAAQLQPPSVEVENPDPPAPDEPPEWVVEEAPAEEPLEFTPVSEIIDEADAKELDWLGELSTGRRVRLQRLGYDVPEKLANLRRSEIRRLARELDVSEKDIRTRWVPAAAAFLKKNGRD